MAPRADEVRVGPLRPVAGLLREHGIDPATVLGACGLSPTALDDPDRRIAYRTAACLVQQAAWAAGQPDFGLRIGERLDVADLGLLGTLVRRAPTVGGALDGLVRFLHVHDRGGVAYVIRSDGRTAALGYSIFDADVPGIGLICDMVIAIAMTLLRGLCGPGFRALEVRLAHAAPADVAPYRRLFAAPIVFDGTHSEVHFEARWLDARIVGADAIDHDLARKAVHDAASGSDRRLSQTVRGVVRGLVMSGSLSAPAVAAALGLHERTLRRRLAAEGTRLIDLIAETRASVARQLLQETGLPLEDIAAALGYAEAAVFVRAFKGWTGQTPARWRRQQQRLAQPSPSTP